MGSRYIQHISHLYFPAYFLPIFPIVILGSPWPPFLLYYPVYLFHILVFSRVFFAYISQCNFWVWPPMSPPPGKDFKGDHFAQWDTMVFDTKFVIAVDTKFDTNFQKPKKRLIPNLIPIFRNQKNSWYQIWYQFPETKIFGIKTIDTNFQKQKNSWYQNWYHS